MRRRQENGGSLMYSFLKCQRMSESKKYVTTTAIKQPNKPFEVARAGFEPIRVQTTIIWQRFFKRKFCFFIMGLTARVRNHGGFARPQTRKGSKPYSKLIQIERNTFLLSKLSRQKRKLANSTNKMLRIIFQPRGRWC
jgi:hypothetical protein